ncbi:hypothetical protein BGZ82_008652 [Podila clonocystis]|nr:hypothetical protein BGZ82_008652 [Podila clonocystis]
MDSDEESDREFQGGEDYEQGSEMSMSSLVRRTKLSRNTTKVAQPIQTESPSKGKSKTSSLGSNHRKKNEKLRKRLMEEVELDEDAGIALLPAKRTRNLSNSSFRQSLQRLRSKGFANWGDEEESSSESSDGSDSSGDDSDIPDSQGNIASFVIQDNEEEAEKVLAQIPEKFRRDQDQTPKNDFKLYIEYLFWLVYDKHALDNQESKYDAPVQRIMKILSTYQSTLSSSGVWSPIFLSLVDQRPKMRKVVLVDEEETFCAACKNTSHKARFAITLFGAEYEVPMKPSELDRFSTMFSPSTGTQRIDTNSDGQEFRFKLGTICSRRSMLYHRARHFSYQCVWKIIDHCTRKQKNQPGQTSAQKLAQKQKKSNDTDRVDAASLLWSELDDLKDGVTKLNSGSK